MLSPDYILRISDGGEAIAEQLHQDIIKRIVERIALRLSRGEDYILTSLDKWQIEVLRDAGYLREDIEKEIAKYTGLMQKEIAEAMEDAGVTALGYDDAVYKAAGLSPVPLEKSPYLIRLMQRNYEATVGEWVNFTRTTADACQQAFVQACDAAYHQVSSGAIGYAQAYREAIGGLIEHGAMVTYPSGHTDTIETATLRCIRTGIAQATAAITDARMEEMDWDIILVSSHLGARVTDSQDFTNHAWWQGKFYSKSGKDKRFPPFSVCGQGNVQGIHGANCRHSHGPGDGEFNPFREYDSEENQKEYELQQKQRALERRIRSSKREVMGLRQGVDSAKSDEAKALMEHEYQKASALLQKRNKAYNDFCEENNLKKLNERIAIAKWDRRQAAKARAAAKQYAKDHPDSVAPKEYKPNTKTDVSKKEQQTAVVPQERIRRRRQEYFERQRSRQQPQFDHMSKYDLDKYVSDNISATFDNVSGVNIDFYRKAVKSVNTVETVYGKIDGLKVSFGGIKGSAYAEYDPKSKTLFLKKKGSLSQFAESLAKADERTLRKYGIKYNAVSTYEGVVLHELGHAVDHDGQWKLSRKLGATDKMLIKARSISFYARTNSMPNVPRATEATAENLSAYFANEYEKIDKDVLAIIEDYINNHKQR